MCDINEIADKADVIVNGYAFEKRGDFVHVLNLNYPQMAVVFNKDDEVIETTMDDIEISIVQKYLQNSKKYMEE